MQPIRPPSFADILEDLTLDPRVADAHPSKAAPASVAAGRSDWLFRLFPNEGVTDAPMSGQPHAFGFAYRETAGEAPIQVPALSEEERVAAELELDTAANLNDLTRIRRAFARRNHPDLMRPDLCAQATGRMKIANMLIDRRRREIKLRG